MNEDATCAALLDKLAMKGVPDVWTSPMVSDLGSRGDVTGFDGALSAEVRLPGIIAHASRYEVGRKNFTIAHEIAHSCCPTTMSRRYADRRRSKSEQELAARSEATEFAAEPLFPSRLFERRRPFGAGVGSG